MIRCSAALRFAVSLASRGATRQSSTTPGPCPMPLQLRRVLRKALMTGQYWVDSETGIPIQTTGTMIATVTRNGRAEAIEVQMRDVLIFAASKGLWKRE